MRHVRLDGTVGKTTRLELPDDLEHGKLEPLYTIDEGAHSGILPGGAATAAIRFSPYVLAARFVLSGRAIERNIRKTAREISGDIVKRIRK